MSSTNARGSFNQFFNRRPNLKGIGKRTSFSLDLPVDLQSAAYPPVSAVSLETSLSRKNSIKTRDADRYFLYLPRNLSCCQLCADMIGQHVQKKVQLLNARLNQLEDLPDTPSDSASSSPDSSGLWLGGPHSSPSSPASPIERGNLQNSGYKSPERSSSILRKKKRAESFPAPQKREGRKVVRFADALGLDLENIRYMVKSDLPPSIPQSGFSDLRCSQMSLSSPYDIELVPYFTMPSLSSDFDNRVREQMVSLHSVTTADTTVYGIIALLNLTFHKNVFIRYTVNNWNSHHDVSASYIQGSTDGEIDKFAFNIFANPQDFSSQNHSLDFAVCYETQDGREFWDNNNDLNYRLKSKAKLSSFVSTNNHSWVHFL